MSGVSEGYTVMKITQKEVLFPDNQTSSTGASDLHSRLIVESEETNTTKLNNLDIILSIFWKNNKLGASYYKIAERQLYFMQEMIDLQPEYRVMKALIQETSPLHVITIGSMTDVFIKSLIDIVTNSDNTLKSEQTRNLPPNVTLLSFKTYAFEVCIAKIFETHLASQPIDATQKEKEILLHSLIDLDNKLSVHALGALIKFIEKNWTSFRDDNNTTLQFIHINRLSLADRVFIDRNTFNALQIFKVKTHDARFKHGGESSNKEGIGLFKLFSQHCKSKIGHLHMRYLMMNPSKNLSELCNRLDFIEFAMEPRNQSFIENITEEIKHISDLNKILVKILYSQAKTNSWNTLHKTICHMLCINEQCRRYRQSLPILQELDSFVTTELYNLQETINRTLELSVLDKNQRPLIKFGLDNELDEKKLKQKDIAKTITAAANFAVNQLPDFINECSVVFLPEMGHLVSIKEWEPDCDKDTLQGIGYQFVFQVRNNLLYKNSLCKELDKRLGNIQQEILAHETRIIQRLSGFVLQHSKNIRESLHIISRIDCLIAMSMVAKEGNYIRPQLNNDNFHEIVNGRHPIFELHLANFVDNNYVSGGNNINRIKILTGPNSSGKSVYLKQVAILMYLAHIGSCLPADGANIGIVDSIYSRISATETASVPLSAHMIDLVQMSQILHNSGQSSLVLIDEFGRGTAGEDGRALLAGTLKTFIHQKNNCPHVLVSTHYQTLIEFLPDSPLINYLKMDYILEDEKLVFLYKVVQGVSMSFAFDVATAMGLKKDIVTRAQELFNSLKNNELIKPQLKQIPPRYRNVFVNDKTQLERFAESVLVPEVDVEDE
ncbi:mutS protein homolog 5 [Agrilus planipennis]|uniref:MutS protein homolog 5 n=1 Tax=Agrilus planipennis TaxID=224129 RepID=A0A1W4WQK2_AGRPL|nr:mutS protein homolog 5 [Agrilus planipennis]